MKKLLAALSVVTASVTVFAAQASAQNSPGGTTAPVDPAEEPTWAIPIVVAFVLVGLVAAVLSARRGKRDRSV